jgi:hypothetical protein
MEIGAAHPPNGVRGQTRILIHKGEHASRRSSNPSLGQLIAKGWAAQTKVGMTGLGLQAGDYFRSCR